MKLMFNGQPVFGPRGPAGPDGNPIGTVISYMGTKAPEDYLVCDGAVYNIADYSKLAEFFQEQFGSASYFGGDGTATFALPDMRNLFLRGYRGEAEEQLSGELGVRQEGTEHLNIYSGASSHPFSLGIAKSGQSYAASSEKPDAVLAATDVGRIIVGDIGSGVNQSQIEGERFTSRPVNMAVLYCIKAASSGPWEDVYSTEETVVGRWIDRKPVYRNVIPFDVEISGSGVSPVVKASELSIDYFVYGEWTAEIKNANTHCVNGQMQLRNDGYLHCLNTFTTTKQQFHGFAIILYTKTTDEGGEYMNECAESCPYRHRIEALEEESQHNKDAHKEFYGKLEASHTSVALIEQRLDQIKEDTEEIKATVQVMRDKPGKRWDGLVEKALWAVAAAVIAFLLGRVGL